MKKKKEEKKEKKKPTHLSLSKQFYRALETARQNKYWVRRKKASIASNTCPRSYNSKNEVTCSHTWVDNMSAAHRVSSSSHMSPNWQFTPSDTMLRDTGRMFSFWKVSHKVAYQPGWQKIIFSDIWCHILLDLGYYYPTYLGV